METLLDRLCSDLLNIISSYEPYLFIIGETSHSYTHEKLIPQGERETVYDNYVPITKKS